MSTGDLMDDDPDIGAAVTKLLARGASALGDGESIEDERENRTDREAHERAEDGDMTRRASEEEEPVEANGNEDDPQGAVEGGDEQFLEIPGEEEGAEPIKVPLTEAAQAVKQLRQMNGDIAAAVVKAETEAQEKSDALVRGMTQTYDAIANQARTAAHLMQQFLPQPPNKLLLDRSSEYHDPVLYYEQKAYYDEYVAHYQKVLGTISQAEQGKASVMTQAEKAEADRENARLARFIPEWGDEKTRDAKRDEILGVLNAKYGITKDEFGDVTNHKAWRMMNDLAKSLQTQAKAPEVRKAVQEKAAKIVNGKLPARDPNGTGRFVAESRKQLRETGSEEAAARHFMQSGLTRSLL